MGPFKGRKKGLGIEGKGGKEKGWRGVKVKEESERNGKVGRGGSDGEKWRDT